jgi:hypothetical protein
LTQPSTVTLRAYVRLARHHYTRVATALFSQVLARNGVL